MAWSKSNIILAGIQDLIRVASVELEASEGKSIVATVLITGHGIPNAVASAGDRYQESMETVKDCPPVTAHPSICTPLSLPPYPLVPRYQRQLICLCQSGPGSELSLCSNRSVIAVLRRSSNHDLHEGNRTNRVYSFNLD